jgi:hypothetical protein
VAVASAVADNATKYNVDAIFIDGGGVGGPIVDMLKTWKFRVIEVKFGGGANEPLKYKNKRAELWGLGKQWLLIGAVPNSDYLKKDFVSPHYHYDPITNQLIIESKDDMLERGRASTDEADALFTTFSQPVARNDRRISKTYRGNQARVAPGLDYPMFD